MEREKGYHSSPSKKTEGIEETSEGNKSNSFPILLYLYTVKDENITGENETKVAQGPTFEAPFSKFENFNHFRDFSEF